MNDLTSQRETWVLEALEPEKLINCKVNVTGSSEKGDGFLGGITFVTVSGTTEAGEKKEFNLVVKDGSKSEKQRTNLGTRLMFEREVYIYDKIFPTYTKFQLEKGVKEPFNSYPKCYKTFIFKNMEVVILENLKKIGFELHSIKNYMNLNHMKKVFVEYGKLHALSFALRDQKPEIFQKLTENLPDLFKMFMSLGENFTMISRCYKSILKLLQKANELALLEKYQPMDKEMNRFMFETDYQSDPHSVIVHGDCWNNNFMFQYEGEQRGIPKTVALLDFQVSKLASPTYDLAYFFYAAAGANDYKNLNVLLDVYYESLSTFLRKLGSDPDKVFPKYLLKEHWKKYSKIGLIFAPLIQQVRNIDMDVLRVDADDINEMFAFDIADDESYDKAIISLVKHFVEEGLL